MHFVKQTQSVFWCFTCPSSFFFFGAIGTKQARVLVSVMHSKALNRCLSLADVFFFFATTAWNTSIENRRQCWYFYLFIPQTPLFCSQFFVFFLARLNFKSKFFFDTLLLCSRFENEFCITIFCTDLLLFDRMCYRTTLRSAKVKGHDKPTEGVGGLTFPCQRNWYREAKKCDLQSWMSVSCFPRTDHAEETCCILLSFCFFLFQWIQD